MIIIGERCFTLEEIDNKLKEIDARESILSMIGDKESEKHIKNNSKTRLELKKLRDEIVESGESQICIRW